MLSHRLWYQIQLNGYPPLCFVIKAASTLFSIWARSDYSKRGAHSWLGDTSRRWRHNQHRIPALVDVAKLFAYFSTVLFWLLDGQSRTRLKRSSCYLRLVMPLQYPTFHVRNHKDSYQSALFSLCNQELPCSLSHVSLKTQFPSCVCEEALFVCPRIESYMVTHLTLLNQIFHTKP